MTNSPYQPERHRLVDYFDYKLPPERIAQEPIEPRDAARMLVDRSSGPDAGFRHHTVADLVDLLDPGDVLVLNDTRVIPARLPLVKSSGGKVEVLLLEPMAGRGDATAGGEVTRGERWEALVRGGRRIKPGTELHLAPAEVGQPGAAATEGQPRPLPWSVVSLATVVERSRS